MNYNKITYPDLNNGPGCRVTLWISGCNHHCPGCHNAELWDKNNGKNISPNTIMQIGKLLELPYISGLTISGGDIMSYSEMQVIGMLCQLRAITPKGKTIWLYTGNSFSDIPNEIKKLVDVIIDGEYKEELRDITLPFRGSSNQKINYIS